MVFKKKDVKHHFIYKELSIGFCMDFSFLFNVTSFWISLAFFILVSILSFLLIKKTKLYYELVEVEELKFLNYSLKAFFVSNIFIYFLKVSEIVERFGLRFELIESFIEVLFIICLVIFIYYSSIIILSMNKSKFIKKGLMFIEFHRFKFLFLVMLVQVFFEGFFILLLILITLFYLFLFIKINLSKSIKLVKRYIIIYLLFLFSYLLNVLIILLLDNSKFKSLEIIFNFIFLILFYFIFQKIYYSKK